MENVLLRCRSCGTINKVRTENLKSVLKCGSCKNDLEFHHKPLNISDSSYQNEVASWPGTVLVEFWSPTCGYCRMLDPILNQIAEEKAGLLKIVRINTYTDPNLAVQYGIQGVPYMILFRGGKKLNELAGMVPKPQLESWISASGGY